MSTIPGVSIRNQLRAGPSSISRFSDSVNRVAPISSVLALVVIAILAGARPAGAQQVTPSLGVDGTVNAMTVSGNTLYLGGEFTAIGAFLGGWAAVDTTAAIVQAGFPRVA